MWMFKFVIALLFAVFIFLPASMVKVDTSSTSGFSFGGRVPLDNTSQASIVQPEGVEVDSEGNLYVNDIEPNSIIKFSKNGSYILSWGSTGSDDGEFNHPHGNDIDQDGNVYITDQVYE
jgi:DNA-binding beta-propeller fold protein YncE